MPINVSMDKIRAELIEIVRSVFGTMMSLDVVESGLLWFPSGERLTATVYLTGEWNGAVLLECDRADACRLAGRFLGMDPPEAVDDVVRDVIGELANMIGGNLKSSLSAGIRLSMPSVVDGGNYSLRICGAPWCERLCFRHDEGLFWVTLLTAP
jgi:chemotaxis protein CheX